MKCCAYVRSSTDKQAASPDRQRQAITAHADKASVKIVSWFEDVGLSGDDDTRPGFQAMIAAAERGDFERIICFDRARFGRGDSVAMSRWTDRLRRARVTLETAVDGRVVEWSTMIGRLRDAFDAEISQEYLVTLARSTTSGKIRKAADPKKNGLPGQPPTYGRRRVVVSTSTDGRKIVSTSEVDPITGPVVERMFHDYLKPGASVRSIAHSLNREGIPSARGSVWSCSAVRGVLENPIHAGDVVFGVRQSGKHAAIGPDGTIVDRQRGDRVGRGHPIVHRGLLPPTVPREVFDRVQQLLQERRLRTVPPKKVRILSGVAACGCCGQTMRAVDGNWRCIGDPRFGKACRGHVVRQDSLTTAVAKALQDAYTSPKRLAALQAELIRQATAVARPAKGDKASTAALDKRISAIGREITAATAKLPLMPARAAVELGKHIDTLAARRDTLTAERAAAAPALAARDAAGVPGAVRAALGVLKRLGDALAGSDPAVANELLREIGARAAMSVDDGERVVRVTFGNPSRTGGYHRRESLRLSRSCPPSAQAQDFWRSLPAVVVRIAS